MNRIFGTDGIRGRANQAPMTPDMLTRIAQAAGRLMAAQGRETRVLIGKDTRISGYMIENALVAGFTSVGMDVSLTGPLPTPGIAMLTRSLRADLGVMISASHNPYQDNGIKFFGPDGAKLGDAQIDAIEAMLADGAPVPPLGDEIGHARRIDGAVERYGEFAKRAFPRDLRLDGMKIVVDAAHGAAFRVAPQVIWELGAEVVSIASQPDGRNINADCGSTAPQRAQQAVIDEGADLGIALDGDADRVHLIDQRGRLIDGDQLMALIGEQAAAAGTLRAGTVVATIMSNLGLERHLIGRGIALARTRVGDRHVAEEMQRIGANVGGEQSGHIILSDFSTSGDGLIAALQALAAMARSGAPASEVLHRFEPLPQSHRNVRIQPGARPMDEPAFGAAIRSAQDVLGARGRIVVRPSGTEPMIRIMAEGEDAAMIDQITRSLAGLIAVPQTM